MLIQMFRKNTSKFIDDFVFKGNYPKCLSGQSFPFLGPFIYPFFCRTTARPTGVPGKLPALRCLMSAALQAQSHPCRWPLSFPPCRRHSLPCRRHTYPVQTPAGPGTLATFETRSLSTSLKKVSAGAPSVLNLLMFSTYCMYCIATALHCIALLHCFEL